MTCRCCQAETSVTFAQHLLHTYLRRFHDLYVCKECLTYHRAGALLWMARILFVLSDFIVITLSTYEIVTLIGFRYEEFVLGTGTVVLLGIWLLFEFIVYKLENHSVSLSGPEDKGNLPYTWEKPGFIKNLLHNYLGRYDYLFVDYRKNVYFRENHWVSAFRLSWSFFIDLVDDLLAFFLPWKRSYLVLGLLLSILSLAFALSMEYLFYKRVPYKQQRLTIRNSRPGPKAVMVAANKKVELEEHRE